MEEITTSSSSSIPTENMPPKSPINRSPNKSPVPNINQKRIIENGYVKKGESATTEDAIALGLKPEDSNRIYICDRFGDFVMFHFKDDYDKISPAGSSVSSDFSRGILKSSTDGPEHNKSEDEMSGNERSGLSMSMANISVESTCVTPDFLSSDEDISSIKARVSTVRGWILRKSTNTLVAKSFSESAMFFTTPEEFEQIEWEGYIFKPHVEGITIRVFWDASTNEWKHSSHKKINCLKSRVPGVEIEFQDLFQQAAPNFDYARLNKNLVYVFHIMHKDNQHMNPEPVDTPILYHLMTIAGYGTICPMRLLEPNSIVISDSEEDSNHPKMSELDKLAIINLKLEGVQYLDQIPVSDVPMLLRQGKRVMAQCEYEVTQIVPESLRKLIEIRGYEKTKHIPVELMYMRLSKADRPLLVSAVPHHMRADASAERMEHYITYNAERLSHVCAYVLYMKLRGVTITVSKTLLWLVKQVILVVRDLPYEGIRYEFVCVIKTFTESKGDTIYRCFKNMEHVISKIKETHGFDIDALVAYAYATSIAQQNIASRPLSSSKSVDSSIPTENDGDFVLGSDICETSVSNDNNPVPDYEPICDPDQIVNNKNFRGGGYGSSRKLGTYAETVSIKYVKSKGGKNKHSNKRPGGQAEKREKQSGEKEKQSGEKEKQSDKREYKKDSVINNNNEPKQEKEKEGQDKKEESPRQNQQAASPLDIISMINNRNAK